MVLFFSVPSTSKMFFSVSFKNANLFRYVVPARLALIRFETELPARLNSKKSHIVHLSHLHSHSSQLSQRNHQKIQDGATLFFFSTTT
jgi:predicted MPP superfamily phosphohydrolase